jgi:hypothetical protein
MLERTLTVPSGSPKLHLEIGYLKYRPWRLQVLVNDDILTTQIIGQPEAISSKDVPPNAQAALPDWTAFDADLAKYSGQKVVVRLYQWLVPNEIPGAAYWRAASIQ